MPGDRLKVAGSTEPVVLSRTLTMSELRRIRRQFTTYTKTHPIEDGSRIATVFVQFLNSALST